MYPDVEIEYDGTGFGAEYVERLYIGAATETAPDVASVSIIWARELFDAGALLPLNDLIARTPDLAPEQFIPTTQLYNQKDGDRLPWKGFLPPHTLQVQTMISSRDQWD